MATGFPVKGTGGSTSYANGNSLSASDLNDGFGTLNLLAAFYTGNPALVGALETCNVVASAATGTINVDAKTSTVWYYTSNASANFTLNFRANSSTTLASILATGQSITIVFLNTNGSTPYYSSTIQIDGSTVTPKWQGGSAPTGGNASAIDAYSFTIIKTAATPTYTVIGSQTKFA
jgi:hypothetical protein